MSDTIHLPQPPVDAIVPVYRAERFLSECVESLLEQDYPNFHIILVDDGSPDACPRLCDDYARRYANVSVIHQENQGVSAARAAGLAAAKGTYVLFVDSDDILDGAHALSALVSEAERSGADITVGAYRRLVSDGPGALVEHHLRGGEYADTVDFRFKGFVQYNHLSFVWGKLYRRDFLTEQNLRFDPYPFIEDKAFNMRCCALGARYAFVSQSVYLYRENGDSVTSRYQKDTAPVWLAAAKDFDAFLTGRGLHGRLDDLIAFHVLFGSFFTLQQEARAGHGVRKMKKLLQSYGEDPLVRGYASRLAKGEFVRCLESRPWRIAICGAARLLKLRAYGLYARLVSLLCRLQIDSSVAKARSKDKGST